MAKTVEKSVTTGSFISLKSGTMSYGGNPIENNELDVIIIDAILENSFFPGKYDPKTPQSPICYAFGRADEDMKPHENVEEPEAEACDGCPHNEWGSADVGRGKACKNVRRVAVILADVLEKGAEAIADAEVAYLKVPVTSVKAWAGYVNKLASVDKPTLKFITKISVVGDDDTQFKVNFTAVEELQDPAILEALLDKADAVAKLIEFPYQKVDAAPAKPARTPAKPAAKAPAKPKKF
jgi:hypothetical protein